MYHTKKRKASKSIKKNNLFLQEANMSAVENDRCNRTISASEIHMGLPIPRIPDYVYHNPYLSRDTKDLYGAICNLAKKSCVATNNYLGKAIHVSKYTVSKALQDLVKWKLIEIVTIKNRRQIIPKDRLPEAYLILQNCSLDTAYLDIYYGTIKHILGIADGDTYSKRAKKIDGIIQDIQKVTEEHNLLDGDLELDKHIQNPEKAATRGSTGVLRGGSTPVLCINNKTNTTKTNRKFNKLNFSDFKKSLNEETENPCEQKIKKLSVKQKINLNKIVNPKSLSPKKTKKQKEINISQKVKFMINYWNKQEVLVNFNDQNRNTKIFVDTIQTLNKFLLNKLYLLNNSSVVFPDNFSGVDFDCTVNEFCKKVDQLVLLITSHEYYPVNKEHIAKTNLITFLKGNMFSKMPSVLLAYCAKEPMYIRKIKYPEEVETLKEILSDDFHFSKFTSSDTKNMEVCIENLIEFLNDNNLVGDRKDIKNHFIALNKYLAPAILRVWKNPKFSTNFLASPKFIQIYEDHLEYHGIFR